MEQEDTDVHFNIYIGSRLLKDRVREQLCFSKEFVEDKNFPKHAADMFRHIASLVQLEIVNRKVKT